MKVQLNDVVMEKINGGETLDATAVVPDLTVSVTPLAITGFMNAFSNTGGIAAIDGTNTGLVNGVGDDGINQALDNK